MRGSLSGVSAIAIAMSIALSSASAHAAGGDPKYYGGHVVANPQIVPVMWNSAVAADVVSGAETYYGAIANSPFIDWLGEYDTMGLMGAADGKPGTEQRIHRGAAMPLVTLVPTTAITTITDDDIQTELQKQIASGALPAPHVGEGGGIDTIYMISFPQGFVVKDFTGENVCSGACAYHWTATIPNIAAGVPYAVIPDCSAPGGAEYYCALGGVFDTFTGDASHELVEAITDPECGNAPETSVARPLAWFDPAPTDGEGEIADLCLSDPTAFVMYDKYLVQASWSQRLGRCITSDPSLTLCDGSTHPCTPCGASDCSGATTCDVAADSATLGQCIAGAANGASSANAASDGGIVDEGGSVGASSETDTASAASSNHGGCSHARNGEAEPTSAFALFSCAAFLLLRARRRR